jgi:alkylhydroperoxidase/carboxymuconolactone decarboxylase family protein YurZ
MFGWSHRHSSDTHKGSLLGDLWKRPDLSEVITHIAFYAGWPNAFSAVPVAKGVFDSRPN